MITVDLGASEINVTDSSGAAYDAGIQFRIALSEFRSAAIRGESAVAKSQPVEETTQNLRADR